MIELTKALIQSWTLEPADYLDYAEEKLLDLLIDAGFIFAYETVACQLRLYGRSPSARQDNVAQNIAQSSLTLLMELLASDSAASPRSQTRIFGLLATMVNMKLDLPSDLAREIPFSREAIDCLTTALFSYRSFHCLNELSKVIHRSDIHTPTLRSLLHSVQNFKIPLRHRFEEISGERPTIICIDKRMEEALSLSERITSLSQDCHADEALQLLNEGLSKFPSLLEFHWWSHQLEHEERLFMLPLNLDPTMGCDTRESSCSVALWQAPLSDTQQQRSFLISCIHRLGRPLDQETKESLIRCCQIMATRFNAEAELKLLRTIRETQQTIGADFDPFFLTLLKTSISTYWQNNNGQQHFTPTDEIDASLPALIILTGLPTPLLSAHELIRRHLHRCGSSEVLIAAMQDVDRSILDSSYLQTGIYSYPEVIDALQNEHIVSSRQFYFQNLSFADPSGSCSVVLHVNQEAFRYLGLLTRLFPKLVVIELLPNLDHWISHCLEHIGGFNCEFSIPSKPELIAYAYDYLEIMTIWRKHLNISMHTLQAGRWLGEPPSATTVQLDVQEALLELDQQYHTPMQTTKEIPWSDGEEGMNLRSLVEAYMALC